MPVRKSFLCRCLATDQQRGSVRFEFALKLVGLAGDRTSLMRPSQSFLVENLRIPTVLLEQEGIGSLLGA